MKGHPNLTHETSKTSIISTAALFLALLILATTLLPLIQAVAATEGDQDTRYFRERGGLTDQKVPKDIELKWEALLEKGPIDSSPVAAQGKLIVRSAGIFDWGAGAFEEKPTLFCFELNSGKELWETELDVGSGWELSTPLIWEEKVFVGTTAGYVLAFGLDTGQEVWRRELHNSSQHFGVTSSLVPLQGSGSSPGIVVADGSGTIYALNANDGSSIWQRELGSEIYFTSPVVNGERLYIGTDSGTLFCLDSGDGSIIWSIPLIGRVRTTPFLDGNYLYLATISYQDAYTPKDGYLYKLHDKGESCEPVWLIKKEPSSSSVVCSDDSVYYASGESIFSVTKDNQTRWSFDVSSQIQSSLVYSSRSDVVLFTSNEEIGKFYAVKENGARLWEEIVRPDSPVFATPLLADGVMVVCSDSGGIQVFMELNLDVGLDAPAMPVTLTALVLVAVLMSQRNRWV